MGLAEELAKGGIQSNEGIVPAGSGGLNFGSLFDSGNPINIGSLPTLGLSGLEGFAGVDIPGFNDNIGSTIGSGLGLIAAGPLGALAGNFLGGFGGKMFGGGGPRNIPLPDFTVPSNTPSIIDTPNILRHFRGSGGEGGILTGQKKSVHQVFWPAKTELFNQLRQFEGVVPEAGKVVDALRDEFEKFSNPVASSPGDSVNKNQALANIASHTVSLLDSTNRRLAFLGDNPSVKAALDRRVASNPGENKLDLIDNLFGFLGNENKAALGNFESRLADSNDSFDDIFSERAQSQPQPQQPGTQSNRQAIDKARILKTAGKAALNFLRVPRIPRIPRRTHSLSGGFSGGGFSAGTTLEQEAGTFVPSGFISKQQTTPERQQALSDIV